MNKAIGWLQAASIVSGLACSANVMATTGYFQLGYGAKSLGLAGAIVSNPQDSLAASVNPAGMGLVGERVDAGLQFFSPSERRAKLDTSALGATFDVEDNSRRNLFIIPSLGYTSKVNDKLSWGISLYGNGGMNTTYERNIYDETAAFLGAVGSGVPPALVPEGATTGTPDTGTLGIDLAQAILAPTISFKVHEKHTLGASLLLGVQRFSARGLGDFQCLTKTGAPGCTPGSLISTTPSDSLTNNGNDWSYGAGVRVGWIGEVHPQLSLGAAIASKIYMTEFDDYDELFAENGDFDIPANFTVGLTFRPVPDLSLSLDFQRIYYEGIKSISNTGPIATPAGPGIPPGSGLLGASNGLGFGWENINVYRLAADYRYSNEWNFRAGFSYNDQPIPDDQLLFNVLAPATPKIHATIGFTFRSGKNSEWNFAYMHAFNEKVSSNMTAFGVPGEIEMEQNAIDLSYSYLF